MSKFYKTHERKKPIKTSKTVETTCWITNPIAANANGFARTRVKPTQPIYTKTLSALLIIRVGVVNSEAFIDRFLKQRPIGDELLRRGFENRHRNSNLTLESAQNRVERDRPDQVVRVVESPIVVAVEPIPELRRIVRRIAAVKNGHVHVVALVVGEELGFHS